MNYHIIPITVEHIESFREAVGSVARERKFLSFLDMPSLQMSKDFVESNIKENWPHVIAIIEDKVIGWCDISSLHRPVYAHCGELGIGIISEFRGQGIGKALIQTALQKAKEKGLSRIELTVFQSNTSALALYQSIGFTIEGIKKKGVLIDGNYDDVICMALFI